MTVILPVERLSWCWRCTWNQVVSPLGSGVSEAHPPSSCAASRPRPEKGREGPCARASPKLQGQPAAVDRLREDVEIQVSAAATPLLSTRTPWQSTVTP